MYKDFNNSSSQTTTAREYANELETFLATLRQSGEKLSAELNKIQKAREEIQEEYFATARSFVKATVSDLHSDKIEELSDIAQGVPELGGQSLVFFRQKMLDARDAALNEINKTSPETIDVDGFQDKKDKMEDTLSAAKAKSSTLSGEARAALKNLSDWQKTPEYAFVALNEQIAKQGAAAIGPESRKLYEPKDIFSAAIKWLKGSASYRAVRNALVDYGQGLNGKDVFADIASWTKKAGDLSTAATEAETAYKKSQAECQKIEETAKTLFRVGESIKSDDQILALLQDKIVSYLSNPAFSKAISDNFGEDYPRNISLMSAKLTTLQKLEEGAQAKMESLSKTISTVSAQHQKASRLRPFTQVKADLDTIRRDAAARRDYYDNYANATSESLGRTTSYYPPSSVVYVDNSPNFFEMMIIADILSSHHDHYDRYDSAHCHHFDVSPDAGYTADLVGIDRNTAGDFNLPSDAFDIIPAATEVHDTSNFDFDIIQDKNSSWTPSTSDRDFDIVSGDKGSSWTPNTADQDFDIQPSGRDSSPSFIGNS